VTPSASGKILPVILAGHLLVMASALAEGTGLTPLFVSLQPNVAVNALPSWFQGGLGIHPESDSVLLPLPPLAAQDEIGCFALTVVFQDDGDGGPVVEWIPKEGETLLMSAGLGETGVALGLNARTLLIPQQLALDGGTLRISFAGRFARLLSLTLAPSREFSVAALGPVEPVLVADRDRVLEAGDVSGADQPAREGDHTEGRVVHAVLAGKPLRLDPAGSDASLEFVVPVAELPQGTFLKADLGGIDPESWVEVQVNGEPCGILGAAPFPLDDPRVIFSGEDRLRLAGWRASSLFLPRQPWKSGENSVVLTLQRAQGAPSGEAWLRNVRLEMLFPAAASALPPAVSNHAPAPKTTPETAPGNGQAADPPKSEADRLSTGSSYGNPPPELFHATMPSPLPDGQMPHTLSP
jgi:hypothetical protein